MLTGLLGPAQGAAVYGSASRGPRKATCECWRVAKLLNPKNTRVLRYCICCAVVVMPQAAVFWPARLARPFQCAAGCEHNSVACVALVLVLVSCACRSLHCRSVCTSAPCEATQSLAASCGCRWLTLTDLMLVV